MRGGRGEEVAVTGVGEQGDSELWRVLLEYPAEAASSAGWARPRRWNKRGPGSACMPVSALFLAREAPWRWAMTTKLNEGLGHFTWYDCRDSEHTLHSHVTFVSSTILDTPTYHRFSILSIVHHFFFYFASTEEIEGKAYWKTQTTKHSSNNERSSS